MADVVATAVMVAQEGHAETNREVKATREKSRKVKKRKKISSNHRSVVKEDEVVAVDSVAMKAEDAIVTIVVGEDEGARALTPKVKTQEREVKVSQRTNNKKVVTTSAVVDPEVVVGGVADEGGGDSLVDSIAGELHVDVHQTAEKRGVKAGKKARRSPMRVLRK